MSTFQLLIGGVLVDGDLSMDVVNPATEEVLARAPRASLMQLETAVAAPEQLFPYGPPRRLRSGNGPCSTLQTQSTAMLMNWGAC